ncbi:hypothetical protein [[Mycobacterium] appelbergii]|uniref:hypothetical protein n=1 Tax=[Mycobacterium] appelbergii TaxID=2939269 RepID=UPI0029392D15|nr:hypothetical protein [Mycobacterium sp. 21AC1]
MKLLAAAAGLGALSVLGFVAAIDGAAPSSAATSAMKSGSTTTMSPPPATPEISFASPTVKAPHK